MQISYCKLEKSFELHWRPSPGRTSLERTNPVRPIAESPRPDLAKEDLVQYDRVVARELRISFELKLLEIKNTNLSEVQKLDCLLLVYKNFLTTSYVTIKYQ